jgi:hypothetical protein
MKLSLVVVCCILFMENSALFAADAVVRPKPPAGKSNTCTSPGPGRTCTITCSDRYLAICEPGGPNGRPRCYCQ